LEDGFLLFPDLGYDGAHAGIAPNQAHEGNLPVIKGNGGNVDDLPILFDGPHKPGGVDGSDRNGATEEQSRMW